MHRLYLCIAAVLMLAACTNADDLDRAPAPLGDFHLGYNVAVAPNLTKGPGSRDASAEEWIEAMKQAVDDRFSRYEGSRLYHIAVSIEGYVLAVTGIPLVIAPKSALIIRVTVWDDAAGVKLNEKPEQITVIETVSGRTLLGSGLTQTKEVQMENLSRNSAKLIQKWLVRENGRNGWFEGDKTAGAETAAHDRPPDSDSPENEDPIPTPAHQTVALTEVVMEPDVAPVPDAREGG